MKTTVREFEAKTEQKNQLSRYARLCEDEQDFSMEYTVRVSIKQLEEQYFNLLKTVKVEFYIGYGRTYYREVKKVGKQYFDSGTKMTKGNGYRGIKEIQTITQAMETQMLNDSYTY